MYFIASFLILFCKCVRAHLSLEKVEMFPENLGIVLKQYTILNSK